MKRCSLALVIATLALSCGGSAPPPATPTTNTGTNQVASSDSGDTTRGPSGTLLRHWTLGRDLPFALYADVGGLMKTEVFAVLVPIVLSREEMIPDPKQRECLKGVVTGARELVAGGEGKRNLALVRFESSAETAAAAECLSRALRFDKVAIDGASAAYGDEDTLLIATPSLLFYGSMTEVKTALANATNGAWPSEVALGADQYLACRGTNGTDTSGTCALIVAPDLLRFSVRLNLPSEDAAKFGAGVLGNFSRAARTNAAFRGLSYEQKGSRLDVDFEARGGAADQAQQVGIVSALAIHGVRKYLHTAKQGEARVNVDRIAKAYATRSTPPNKLSSLPDCPKYLYEPLWRLLHVLQRLAGLPTKTSHFGAVAARLFAI